MELFLQISLSFPTLIFSVLLAASLCYWLVAMLGLVEMEFLDVSVVTEGDVADLGGVAGLLMKFGLDGLPLTVIATAISLIAWLLSFYADYFLLQHLPFDVLRYSLGAAIVLGALILATPMAGLVLQPLRGLFAKVKPVSSESLLGKSAIVRSPEVNLSQGTVALEDGGAGLILQARAEPGQFKRNDRVVLVEYLDSQNAYRIIADRLH